VQNLIKNHLLDLDAARQLVAAHDLDLLELCFGSVSDTLAQLIRTAFVAPPGKRFIVADFSAIEARILAWLARESWRLQVFNSHGKIYEASAAQMFKVPLEAVTKGSDYRFKGKIAELALGYQGAVDALIRMGALTMGLVEEELPKLVKMWRNANPGIVRYWRTVNDAAIEAVDSGQRVKIYPGITFFTENNVLFIKLPSGRRLSYYAPHLVDGKYGPSLRYWGMDQMSKQWRRIDTYGGKLVENITQAIARDCLAEALIALDDKGYWVVMHVHDEVVIETPDDRGSLEEVNEIMSRPIPWAKGLPLTADSYETKYYRKD
jgi:DNA polymerase